MKTFKVAADARPLTGLSHGARGSVTYRKVGMVRFIVSIIAGCFTAIVIAVLLTVVARIGWPAYAAAEPHKTYTLVMLMARLVAGVLSTAGASAVATIIARDRGPAAWALGVVFFAIAFPAHAWPGTIWNDYPAWYHVVFLGYLIPVAGLTGWALRRAGEGR